MPKVILIYDVNTEDEKGNYRLQKALKTVRRYLHHIQRSVFEGRITHAKLVELKLKLKAFLDPRKDSVIIYLLDDRIQWRREILSGDPPADEDII